MAAVQLLRKLHLVETPSGQMGGAVLRRWTRCHRDQSTYRGTFGSNAPHGGVPGTQASCSLGSGCRNTKAYGITAWPFAYLIGADGKVFWEGNPSRWIHRKQKVDQMRTCIERELGKAMQPLKDCAPTSRAQHLFWCVSNITYDNCPLLRSSHGRYRCTFGGNAK